MPRMVLSLLNSACIHVYGPVAEELRMCGWGPRHPRSQCVGGMLLAQWCYKHVLNCRMHVGSPGGKSFSSRLGDFKSRWITA